MWSTTGTSDPLDIEWSIAQKELSIASVSVDGKVYDGDTSTTNGAITLSGMIDGEEPTASGTFTWVSANAETGSVNVSDIALDSTETNAANANYTLPTTSLDAAIPSNSATITDAALKVTASNYSGTYDGNAHTISVSATSVNDQTVTITYADVTNGASGVSYSTTAPTFTDYGTYTVAYIITADNHTTVTGEKTVTIDQKALTSEDVDLAVISTHTYTGIAQTADFTLTDSSDATITTDDYEAVDTNNTAAGTATLTIKATSTGNYSGTISTEYTIEKRDLAFTEVKINDVQINESSILGDGKHVVYNTVAYTPTVVANYNDNVLDAATDFEYSYANNTDAGTATVTITAKDNGNYTGYTSATFTIDKAPVTFKFVPDTTLVYSQSEQNASDDVSATWAKTLVGENTTNESFTDYTLTYEKVGDSQITTPLSAGSYTVTATINATSTGNYYVASTTSATAALTFSATHDIAQKEIWASWLDTTQTYTGSELFPTISFYAGVINGDSVANTAGETEAGSYTLALVLNNDNYFVSTSTASHSFTIQKDVVSVTLNSDGTITATSGGVVASLVEDTDYTLSYVASNGTVYDSISDLPTTTATYTVVVTLSETLADNYNIEGFTGSTASVGSYKVNGTSSSYTASFKVEGTVVESLTLTTLAGAVGIVPSGVASTDETQNLAFSHWTYGGKTYQPGDTFTQPSSDITFTAVYQAVYSITTTVTDADGNPLENAVVSIVVGSEVIAQAVTNDSGIVIFSDITAGVYNVVCEYNGIEQTIMADISEDDADLTVKMPSGSTSSVVVVSQGSPSVVVGEMENAFATDGTDDDDLNAGSTIELKLVVDDTTTAAGEALIDAKTSNALLYMEISLVKTVTDANGIVTDSTTLSKVENDDTLIEIVIPLPTNLQGKYSYTVYRSHENSEGELELHTITTNPSANVYGEYFELNASKTVMTMYVCQFSTYAIAYANAPAVTTEVEEEEEELYLDIDVEIEDEILNNDDEDLVEESKTDDDSGSGGDGDDDATAAGDGAGGEDDTTTTSGGGIPTVWLALPAMLVPFIIFFFLLWRRKEEEEE